jgi:hypothetical protein
MREPPLTPLLASSATGSSTNCLSAPFPPRHLRLQISLSCTGTVGHLQLCWPMKTRSKRWIADTPIPRVARNLPRSSLNGFGTFDENWDNSSLHLRCARPNVLPRMRLNLLQPMSLNLQQHRPPQARMVHRNGLAHRLRMGFLAAYLRRNPMEASVALSTIRSISRSGAPSAMAPYDSCMPHALVHVVPARCAHSVRRAAPRSSHDGSVRCLGRSPLLTQNPRRLLTQPLLPLLLLRCSGATGHVAASGESG